MTHTYEPLEFLHVKKWLLVVDDEPINREMLGMILQEKYEVLFAEDGVEAMEKLREQKDLISLVLLDLLMPKMNGVDVLREIRGSDEYQDIPVIVASADLSMEIECLNIGASDFIRKPYPEPGVILARVRRAIALFESRKILESTERDPLTGLFNREFFYSYAEQYDLHHKDTEMDAIIIDICRFSTINERYGKAFGDKILRRLGQKAQELVLEGGGIICRREADVFQVYCPHRQDYKALLDNLSTGLADDQDPSCRIRLRMGVYACVDKTLDIERRLDRAKMAADTVRNNYTRNIAVYDDTLHKAELYNERLIEDFQSAIEEKQFQVYYQPKFDVTGDTPRLCGAEALVRWNHPELGMISPGVFIPCFENNGLIQTLDHYVWREAGRQVRAWKDTVGFTVPVSVNISRIDMYDPNIVYTFLEILESNRLEAADLHLEITESAYTEDEEQIVECVKRLRSMGFLIEMDDFGTGYSSLNMLSTLPFDVLKLDMRFAQSGASGGKDKYMLGVVTEIARHLGARVVTEGVETQQQLDMMKEAGCDMVQGYVFSPPVPADKFVVFLTEEKQRTDADTQEHARVKAKAEQGFCAAVSRWWEENIRVSLGRASLFFIGIAIVAAAALYVADSLVTRGYQRMEQANDHYLLAQQSSVNLEVGSDYLTEKAREFAVTGDITALKEYFQEAEVTRRRNHAVEKLKQLLNDEKSSAYRELSAALSLSNELMKLEYRAMNYVIRAGNYDEKDIPPVLKEIRLTEAEQALAPDELRAKAVEFVYGDEYKGYKDRIFEHSRNSTRELLRSADADRTEFGDHMDLLLFVQTLLTILMLVVVLVIVMFIVIWVRNPLKRMVHMMRAKDKVVPAGAEELRFVSETYNSIFDENRRTCERLTYGNMHDALTGLYNRSAYDFMKNDLDMSHNALLLIDVDKFKTVNDTYGHDVGDLVLKRVAEVLKYSFRATDLVFRLGGDEFVVIMSNVDSSMRRQVKAKIDQANVMLQKPVDELPPTSLSVGVAFADRENPDGDIFKDADTALYRMKEGGRCGCVIY
jgi:diguanylate cyclase (GGDEF)-like protein